MALIVIGKLSYLCRQSAFQGYTEVHKCSEHVAIAALTNYESQKNFFDSSAVEVMIKIVIEYNPNTLVVNKSIIPISYTASERVKMGSMNTIFILRF